MKGKAFIVIILGMAGLIAVGADGQSPEILRLLDGLRPTLATLLPKPEVRTNCQSTLEVRYQVELEEIKGHGQSGYMVRVHPTSEGFYLFVQAQLKNEVDKGWTTNVTRCSDGQTRFVQVTPVAGSDKQLNWALTCGSRMNTNLLARILQTMNEMKGKPNQAGRTLRR